MQNLPCDLPFLSEKMVVNNTKKLICNLQDKKDYVVHINVLKQALDNGLKLIKVHQVIEFDQEAWLKEYILILIPNYERKQIMNSKKTSSV